MIPRGVIPWACSLALVAHVASAGTSAAQQVVTAQPATQPATPLDTVVFERPVSVQLQRMPLREALVAVGAAAHVRLMYHKEVLDAVTHLVTLRAKNMPLGKAFEQLLDGTPLVAVPVQRDIVSIIVNTSSDRHALGGISGRVLDAATKHPIHGANVSVDGTKLGASTNEDGTFRVSGLKAGTYRVLVRRIGYQGYSNAVTVKDDSVATLLVALAPAATVLNDVVTTATGERRRFETGNAIGTIKADSIVANNAIRNVSDLLQARIPGVIVSNTSGDVGAPSKIRIRGVNSINLNNDPIVIIDGIRMNAQTTVAGLQTNNGSQQMLGQQVTPYGANATPPLAPSRLDDLDPNIIESIDVLRGPSASSLYGTDAANGVIVIKTKRGKPGSWRSTLTGDYGQSFVPGAFPEIWTGWGRIGGDSYRPGCSLMAGLGWTVGGGGCVQDSVTQFNAQNYGPMRTMGTGVNRSLSGSLSGGTSSLTQFLSAHVSSAQGMAKMSDVEKRLIARLWSVPAPSWMVHPNTEQDVDGSSATTVNISPKADISLTTTGIYRNNLNGGSGIQNENGYEQGPGDSLQILPSENQRTKVTSQETRGTLNATANLRPFSWLSLQGVGGGDYGFRTDQSDLLPQYCATVSQLALYGTADCPSGHIVSRGNTFILTANASANLSFSPRSWLTLHTALGENYSHTRFYNMSVGNSSATNCPLAFGTTLLTPTPVCLNGTDQMYNVAEARDEAATAGIYVEETVNAFGLYTTFGLRQDLASAFGGQVTKSPPNYPKFDFSYPLSEQSFFPKQSVISSLRLRLAYGQSGNQASQTAVLNNYTPYTLTFSGTTPPQSVVTVSQLGNHSLRPEKGTEWEGGFDVSFFENERIHLEATLYRKFTRDMIATSQLTPSLGNYGLYYNLGNVENRGLELALSTKLIDTRSMSWDVMVHGSRNTNKLVHKSSTLPANGPLNTQFHEGYPLFAYWGVPIQSFADVNGDSILAWDEITFGPQTYLGAPYPKGNVTYSSNLALWGGTLRLSTTINQILDQTTQLQVADGSFFPRAAVDRTAPLAQQAAYLQAVVNNHSYMGTSSFIRLNELSATYMVPVRMLRQLHAQSLAITVAGRNLGLWSSYAGKDPEVDTSGLLGEASLDNGLGTPQPRTWLLRFNLGL